MVGKKIISGRIIYNGIAEGECLFTTEPLLFYTGIDVTSGKIIEHSHPLKNKSVKNKILILPWAKGSTVGSYTILQLAKNGVGPLGIINESCEPIVAVGVIISKIPCVDQVDIQLLKNANRVRIEGEKIFIQE
ncbi:MAG: aconitase X swivel domain-containing protein [Promethearchaeota archaeon]